MVDAKPKHDIANSISHRRELRLVARLSLISQALSLASIGLSDDEDEMMGNGTAARLLPDGGGLFSTLGVILDSAVFKKFN